VEVNEFETIRYERPGEGVARIVLAREKTRNAQNVQMLYEIDAALDIAMHDDEVNVVIIAMMKTLTSSSCMAISSAASIS
jgi:enoyl-CoA hydratase